MRDNNGIARRGDWKTEPMPELHESFVLKRRFSEEEMAVLRRGNIPQAMEDKWFRYMEGETLWAHRSWTGFCIYRIDFKEDNAHTVTVNRDPEQYGCTDTEEDAETLNGLLDGWIREPLDPYNEWLSETCRALKKAGGAEVEPGKPEDISSWMELVREVRENFPGLETEEALAEHERTVLRFMSEGRALCVKYGDKPAGVLLFSRKRNMICCLAVKPEYRGRGIASRLLERALSELDPNRDVVVSTFREGDEKGISPRALYKKFGFAEGELTEEFGYPVQVFTLRGRHEGK